MKTIVSEAMALRLVRAFLKIKDPKRRRAIIDFVEAEAQPTKNED